MSLPQSNRPFDTRLLAVRSRPLSSDGNQQFSNDSLTLRELLRYSLGWRGVTSSSNGLAGVPTGAIADSFKLDAGGGMVVSLRQGFMLQDGSGDAPTNLGGNSAANDLSPEKPLVLTAAESITVPTADPTNPRWDSVFAKYQRTINNPQSRGVLNVTTGVFDPTLLDIDETFALDGTSAVNNTGAPIDYVTGTPAASPTKPSTPTGFVRVADVYVPAGAAAITADMIVDQRRLLMPGGVIRVAGGCDVNQSTFAIANAWVDAPPGVDVLIQSYATPGLQLMVLGPFPNITSALPPSVRVQFDPAASAPDGPVAIRQGTLTAGPQRLITGGSAEFPSGVLNGGNVNVFYNAVLYDATYGCWNGSTWTTTGLTSLRVSFAIDIPVV